MCASRAFPLLVVCVHVHVHITYRYTYSRLIQRTVYMYVPFVHYACIEGGGT